VSSLAQIFEQYGPHYRAKYGPRMLASHRRAMADIEQCRTAAQGGHVCYCEHCVEFHYCYHSCQNRHCPQCQHKAGQQWLARQQGRLLPVPYFMVTFTLPERLKKLARSNQKLVYDLLFRSSAAALKELAQDPRFVSGEIGMVGVLQTWARDLSYHPHVHYLVPGGGVTEAEQWQRARNSFLVHVKPLSKLFRGKFRAALKKTALIEQVPVEVWQQDWVVHCQSVGSGEAALKYLAPYIFRVALSNNRIVKVEQDQVTFRYYDNQGKRRYCTLPVLEFTVGTASCSTCCPRASRRSAITACSVRPNGNCSTGFGCCCWSSRAPRQMPRLKPKHRPARSCRPAACPAPPAAGRCGACSNLGRSGAVHRDQAGLLQPASRFGLGSGCLRPVSALPCCQCSESTPFSARPWCCSGHLTGRENKRLVKKLANFWLFG